jgi:hypothetical protein
MNHDGLERGTKKVCMNFQNKLTKSYPIFFDEIQKGVMLRIPGIMRKWIVYSYTDKILSSKQDKLLSELKRCDTI